MDKQRTGAKSVTVFRSRLDPQSVNEYKDWAVRIGALARTMPGYIFHKSFTADDGERVTIVEFDNQINEQAWSKHPEHEKAKQLGHDVFFTEYNIKVCEVLRELVPHKM